MAIGDDFEAAVALLEQPQRDRPAPSGFAQRSPGLLKFARTVRASKALQEEHKALKINMENLQNRFLLGASGLPAVCFGSHRADSQFVNKLSTHTKANEASWHPVFANFMEPEASTGGKRWCTVAAGRVSMSLVRLLFGAVWVRLRSTHGR